MHMKVTEGISWIITCTSNFDQTVAFFRDVMGLAVTQEGVPVTDTQFTRYAQIGLPNGPVLEIVEPDEFVRQLYTAPIVSFTVDDVAQARRELEGRQVEFVAPIFSTGEGLGWTYFRAPHRNVYQLQGAYQE
jgi:predicted enzyme related to lactoylglutathione lyase